MASELIEHRFNGELVLLRARDGYIHATPMCKAAGKQFNDYSRLDITREVIAKLATRMNVSASTLVQTIQGGQPEHQGTWIHPKLAWHLAQWLSADIAILVLDWIEEWHELKLKEKQQPKIPPHLRRYMVNHNNVPTGHFSVFNELTFLFFRPMETAGYIVPESIVPDISEGQYFPRWLEKKGIPLDRQRYIHVYLDKRGMREAWCYADHHIPDFRDHFNNIWLPDHAPRYFRERDPRALPFLPLAFPKQQRFKQFAVKAERPHIYVPYQGRTLHA